MVTKYRHTCSKCYRRDFWKKKLCLAGTVPRFSWRNTGNDAPRGDVWQCLWKEGYRVDQEHTQITAASAHVYIPGPSPGCHVTLLWTVIKGFSVSWKSHMGRRGSRDLQPPAHSLFGSLTSFPVVFELLSHTRRRLATAGGFREMSNQPWLHINFTWITSESFPEKHFKAFCSSEGVDRRGKKRRDCKHGGGN